jgi:hypothetical protein
MIVVGISSCMSLLLRSVYIRKKSIKVSGLKKKQFFSEEKNQKTFTSAPAASLRSWPIRSGLHQKQKSFGSFLQKRTASLDCRYDIVRMHHGR